MAHEVANALDARLDVCLVRKLGMPRDRRLVMRAIASGRVRVLNEDASERTEIPEMAIEAAPREEQAELDRRERAYRDDRTPVELTAGQSSCSTWLGDRRDVRAAVQAGRAHNRAQCCANTRSL